MTDQRKEQQVEGPEMTDARGEMMAARIHEAHTAVFGNFERARRKQACFFRYNFLKHLPKDKNVPILDVGAGHGQFLLFCRDEGYTDLQGIDLSPSNVEHCHEHRLNVKLVNVFDYFASTRQTYGAIILCDVIEHFTKPQIIPLLEGIKKHLRPGGVVIIKTVNMANPILAAHSRYIDFTHEIGWTEECFRQLLPSQGFENVTVHPSHLYVFLKNPFNYLLWFIAWCFELLFKAYFRLHGKFTTHVFSKNLIAVGYAPGHGTHSTERDED